MGTVVALYSKEGGVPIWPFSVTSVGVGAFALLPYFALWDPPRSPLPSAEERSKLPLRILNSRITALVTLLGAVGLSVGAALAGAESWAEYAQYFRESRFIHVMSLDFVILCAFAPFWLYQDMNIRRWSGRDRWWLPLALLPLAGPAIYLAVRPPLPERTGDS
eukprot:SM000362S13785  [mRNA]  locus=s362:21779:22973:+ [translate_table: standard]